MEKRFILEVVTPESLLISQEVEQVNIPGSEGEFGVLAGHAPFISELKPGVVAVYNHGQCIARFFAEDGFAEVIPGRCTILARHAVDLKNISREEAVSRLNAAEEELREADSPEKEACEKARDAAVVLVEALS